MTAIKIPVPVGDLDHQVAVHGREVAFADLALEDPPVDAVRLLGDGVRVIVRPSGTEPKLKMYAEAVVPVEQDVAAARAAASERVDAVLDATAALMAAHGA